MLEILLLNRYDAAFQRRRKEEKAGKKSCKEAVRERAENSSGKYAGKRILIYLETWKYMMKKAREKQEKEESK